MAKKHKKITVKIDIGRKCTTCGKRFINPFGHTCRVKFGVVGKKRIEKKKGGK